MKPSRKLPTYFLLWLGALVAISTLLIVASPKLRNAGKRQEVAPPAEVPKIISKVKDLEVVSITLDRLDEAAPVWVIEIRNNSVKPIVAISVESGDEKDSSGVATEGFRDGDKPPSIILQPYGTITMRMPVGALLPGKPLKVSSVTYADGTDDGEDRAKRDYKNTGSALRPEALRRKESRNNETNKYCCAEETDE